jgi:pyruvate dehydrogenase E2 component (dihydrolipoamide acetyltransferase)
VATELIMPQMGFDMQEGTVVRWLKAEGAEVRRGEPVAEIETDKAVVEFESDVAGVLQKILAPEGAVVPVGKAIAIVAAPGERPAQAPARDGAPPAQAPAAGAVRERPMRPAEVQAPQEDATPAPAGAVRASPVARRLADEMGINLSQVRGTGPGGRITKEDVLAFQPAPAAPPTEAAPVPAERVAEEAASEVPEATPVEAPAPREAERVAPAAGEKVPLSRMRQQIARVTVRSKRDAPHFYVSSEIDMTQAMELRQQINRALEAEGVRVTVNDLIIRACVEALKKYPKFNAYYQEDGIQMNEAINVGIAIAQEEGLLMPAIMDCGSKSLKEIAVASKDLAERAKSGTLRAQEYTGGTFAISNLGMFDVSSFVAIIQPPQAAILAVGTVAKRPVVRDDQVVVAQMMTATLSGDHRIVDGAEGARFLVEVKRLLESPMSLLL